MLSSRELGITLFSQSGKVKGTRQGSKEGRRGGGRDVKERGKVRRHHDETRCPILNTELNPAFERSSYLITC